MASGALRWFLTRETLSQKNRRKNDTIKITSEPFTFFPFIKVMSVVLLTLSPMSFMRSFLRQLWTLDSFIWTLSISSAATRSKVSTTRNGTKRCFWSNWVLFRLARHEVSQQRGESQRGFSFSLLQFVAGNWMRRVIWSPAGRGEL